MPFDPHSSDSMFATVLARLGAQDRASEEFRENAKLVAAQTLEAIQKIGTRVTELENQRWFNRGAAAVIGLLGSALWNWWKGK